MLIYIRVTIHDTFTRVLSDEFGHDVQPSTAANFELNEVMYCIPGVFYSCEKYYDSGTSLIDTTIGVIRGWYEICMFYNVKYLSF